MKKLALSVNQVIGTYIYVYVGKRLMFGYMHTSDLIYLNIHISTHICMHILTHVYMHISSEL